MLLNCGAGEHFWNPLVAQRSNQSILEEINPEYSLEGLMLKLNFNTLAIWCKEPTHWKIFWCWERLEAEEGDDRGWDGWMASPTQWAWVWVNSGSWRWTGRPVMLQSIGSQRVGCDWATDTYLHYSGAFFVCLFVFYYFLFDTIISTRLLFYSSSLSPTVSNFSKNPGSFYWKRVLGTKICAYFNISFFQIFRVSFLLDPFS